MTTAPKPVRLASVLFGCFAAMLVLEAAWIGIAPRWSEAARAWAEMHPAGTVIKQCAAALLIFFLISKLLAGRRWARFLLLAWSSLMALLGALLLIVMAAPGVARGFGAAHPREATAGTLAWLCVAGGALCLLRADARAFFGRQEKSGADDRT